MAQDVAIAPKTLHKTHADDVLLSRPRQALSKDVLRAAHGAELSAVAAYLARSGQGAPDPHSREVGAPSHLAGLHETPGSNVRQRSIPYQSIMAGASDDGSAGRADVETEIESTIVAAMARYSERPASTSFQFVNPANHYFFYRKPHEHVPGIMLLEAARQTIYYQLYRSTSRQLGEVTVSLSEMSARFHHYAELMYPIEIIVDDISPHHSERPSLAHYLTSFYQQTKLVAEVESVAPVISLKRFELARNANILAGKMFAPLPGAPVLAVMTSSDGQATIVQLADIGEGGCVTTKVSSTKNVVHQMTLVFSSSIVFTCQASPRFEDMLGVHWSFDDLAFDQREALAEIVKRGFTASQSR